MNAPQQWVWLARIRRPQGRKGEVFADLLTDFPERFSARRKLWLIAGDPTQKTGAPGPSHLGTRGTTSVGQQARPVELIHHWLHKGGIVLHFAGVDSISAAEALKGLGVAIPRSERAALDEDQTYVGDLIGCTLIDVSRDVPVAAGVIEDVDRTTGAAPLLIVRGARGEILVPFAKVYVRKIDLAAKRLEMALPEGLVELNST